MLPAFGMDLPPSYNDRMSSVWEVGWVIAARNIPGRGKSEHRRAACFLTGRGGNPTESATEKIPPAGRQRLCR